MKPNAEISSQYQAMLSMLQQAIERCPDEMWDAPEDRNRFWRVAYHALFYTHLYLQKTLADFKPWEKHCGTIQRLSEPPGDCPPFSKQDVLTYLGYVRQVVEEQVAALDLSAPSGFEWCRFNKLELQFYNLRHLAQHTGELMERLGARAGIDVGWVMMGEK